MPERVGLTWAECASPYRRGGIHGVGSRGRIFVQMSSVKPRSDVDACRVNVPAIADPT
jgi:hypothetical protein